jgi:hypothetical protein
MTGSVEQMQIPRVFVWVLGLAVQVERPVLLVDVRPRRSLLAGDLDQILRRAVLLQLLPALAQIEHEVGIA